MYARTCNNRIALDVVKAVCHAKARNFRAAAIRRAVAPLRGWLA